MQNGQDGGGAVFSGSDLGEEPRWIKLKNDWRCDLILFVVLPSVFVLLSLCFIKNCVISLCCHLLFLNLMSVFCSFFLIESSFAHLSNSLSSLVHYRLLLSIATPPTSYDMSLPSIPFFTVVSLLWFLEVISFAFPFLFLYRGKWGLVDWI